MHIRQSDYDKDFKFTTEWFFNKKEDGMWSSVSLPTKEDAIAEGMSYGFGDKFYVGASDIPRLHVIDADDVIERMACSADDEHGEISEELFECVTKEERDELTKKLADLVGEWMTKHNLWPSFHGITDVEEVAVRRVEQGEV